MRTTHSLRSARQDRELIGNEDILALTEPRHAQESIGGRKCRIIGDNIGEAAPERATIHLTPEDPEVDRSIEKPVGILADKGVRKDREFASRGVIEESDKDAVMEADPPIGHNGKVPWMWITMKDPSTKI